MISIKRHIPNFFTLMNIVCGFGAINFAFQGELLFAFYFIVGAAFFDFIDGGVARLLHVQSEVGKQLDSLCDVVSFGVAPGVILFFLMKDAVGVQGDVVFSELNWMQELFLFSMALVPAFSALRLAKFNIDTRQTDSFIGMPVPAAALFISSLGAMTMSGNYLRLNEILAQPFILLALSLFVAYMLISPLPMFALKFKTFRWRDNRLRFLFIMVCLLGIIFLGIAGIAFSILMYLIISLTLRLIGNKSC